MTNAVKFPRDLLVCPAGARRRTRDRMWSVPAKSSRRFGGLKLGQVELADCPQSIGGGAVLQVVRQRFQPDGVLGYGVMPASGAAAMIG